MPTPFMHLAFANHLNNDPGLPDAAHKMLEADWGAFLLGTIAPDARISSGLDRSQTHFFEYTPTIDPPPVTVMLTRHPELAYPADLDASKAAFVAGYTSHLVMDAVWCTDLLFPDFLESDWGTREQKFLSLHALLLTLDRRDRALLPDGYYQRLALASPHNWLPFMDDEGLCVWRDTIANQLAPGASSQTLEILARRMGLPAEEFAAVVDDPARMEELVWSHIPQDRLAAVEAAMYSASLDAVIGYLMHHS